MRSHIFVVVLLSFTLIACGKDGRILSGGGSGQVGQMEATTSTAAPRRAEPFQKLRKEGDLLLSYVVEKDTAGTANPCLAKVFVRYPENWTVLNISREVRETRKGTRHDYTLLFSVEGQNALFVSINDLLWNAPPRCVGHSWNADAPLDLRADLDAVPPTLGDPTILVTP